MDRASFAGVNYSQGPLNTCILASYAVACFAFTGNPGAGDPVLQYFVAYCRRFNLDATHPELSYDAHFHTLPRGYEALRDLHEHCAEQVFARACNLLMLTPVTNWGRELATVEAAIRQPDCLLLLFLNESKVPGLARMHSIVVGYDGGLYYFDTGRLPGSIQPGPARLTDFGDLGDAYIVTRKPAPAATNVNPRGAPPIQVMVTVALWAISSGLNLIAWKAQADWQDWVSYPTLAVLVALSLLLMLFIYQGRNWARWLVVALVAFRLLRLLGAARGLSGVSISGWETISVMMRVLFQLGAVILLFSRPSSAWFGGNNRRA